MTHERIDPSELANVLRYEPEAGTLFWLARDAARPSWNTRYAGRPALNTVAKTGYRVGSINNVKYLAHRVIWAMHNGRWPDTIDHIDGDRMNNRLPNLRECTQAENSRNRAGHSAASSRFCGVSWDRSTGSWKAHITLSRRLHHLGRFRCEIEAARRYDAAALELHGEFAVLNFPARRAYDERAA